MNTTDRTAFKQIMSAAMSRRVDVGGQSLPVSALMVGGVAPVVLGIAAVAALALLS